MNSNSNFSAGGATLHLGQVQDVFGLIDSDSIDLAIADPPYGASSRHPAQLTAEHGLKGFGGAWKAADHGWDLIGPEAQLGLALEWLSELKRVVRPEGSIWIHGSYHNIGFVNVACQMLELEIINEVVWFKRNAMPNLRGTRLTASHEQILWVHTGGKKRNYRFNYDRVKASGYEGDSLKFPDKQMRTVWDIPNNKTKTELSRGGHPTQKPERVIQRIIDISGPEQGTLLSPFAGSGTDMVVAMRNGLRSVGAEVDPTYFEMASRRIAAEAEGLGNQLFGSPP